MLLLGEKELADELLNLVKTARQQEATIPEQGKVLTQMGELYLKDAVETGNGEQFIKASALINAALVRTEDENDQNILQDLIRQIYQSFMKTIKKTTIGSTVDELILETDDNQAYLQTIRQEVYAMSENIEHLFNTYSVYIGGEDFKMIAQLFGGEQKLLQEIVKQLHTGNNINIALKEQLEKIENLDERRQIAEQLFDKKERNKAEKMFIRLHQTKSKKERLTLVMQMFGIEEKSKARDFAEQFFGTENWDERMDLIKQFGGRRQNTIKDVVDEMRKSQQTMSSNPLKSPKNEKEEGLLKEVESISGKIQNRMIEFAECIWKQALDLYSVSPPCKYAVIGLGSIARQEITPYSDLEFALLIETDSKENKQFFKNLVYLFHLLILDLGETPIPAMAIESLNDFQSPGGDKFFDRITPRGFRLDGAMPWACKTPIGRKETPQKEALDLIKTPEDMAALQMEENSLGQAYHVADILCNYIFICGMSTLLEKFTKLHIKVISKTDNKRRAKNTLIDDYHRSPDLTWGHFNTFVEKNKANYYRITSTFVENLRVYFTPAYQPGSVWKVLDHLLKANILSRDGAFNLKVLLAICYGFRLLTYFKNNGQYENFMFMKTKTETCEERAHFSLRKRKRGYVAYFSNSQPLTRLYAGICALKRVIEKYFIDQSKKRVIDLREESFIQKFELYQKAVSWTRHGTTLANIKWARSSKELPSMSCGKQCLVGVFICITYITEEAKLLDYINELLERRGCKCLSLVRRNLLVSKAILIQRYSLIGEVPKEASVLALQESYRQKGYSNICERFNLLMDIGELAILIKDKKLKLSVAENITAFFDDVATFEESQQTVVNLFKCFLLETSIKLYRDTEKPEVGVILCEQQIEEYEMELGYNSSSERLGFWYIMMGDLKGQLGLLVEQLYYYQKSFDIFLFVWENDIENHDLMYRPRRTACDIALLHKAQGNMEDAFKVLKKAFTKDGKAYRIKTDIDIRGMLLLHRLFTLNYPGKESEYIEEVLNIFLRKGQGHQLRPDTVIEVAEAIIFQIYLLGYGGRDSYIIENVYRKHCTDNENKEDFLIEILNKLLDDELLHSFLLSRSHSNLDLSPQEFCPSPDLCTVTGHFFNLCGMVLRFFDNVSPINFKGIMAVLKQAEVFCNKVVKKCTTNTIYNMCLIYVEFNRTRLLAHHVFFIKDVGEITRVSYFHTFLMLHGKLLIFFPNCYKAHDITDIFARVYI